MYGLDVNNLFLQQRSMMKIVICTILVSLAMSVTVEKFASTFDSCNKERKIIGVAAALCEYNLITS